MRCSFLNVYRYDKTDKTRRQVLWKNPVRWQKVASKCKENHSLKGRIDVLESISKVKERSIQDTKTELHAAKLEATRERQLNNILYNLDKKGLLKPISESEISH